MWIEIKWDGIVHLVNSDLITRINFDERGFWIEFHEDAIAIAHPDPVILFDGFKLALNGLDFICEGNYIKPLFHAKNESLYRYLMLKECLGENKP